MVTRAQIEDRLHVKFIGGNLALDFVNTVGGRVSAGALKRDYADVVIRDKIAGYGDLADWAFAAGAVDRRCWRALALLAQNDPRQAAGVFARATRLREALYRILKSAVEHWRSPAADMDVLRAELAIARTRQQLVMRGRTFAWQFPQPPDALDRVLWPVALAAAGLLTSPDLEKVRQCGGHACGWFFLDTSRNRRRQWCDMRDCGNRAKVQRFRARRAQSEVA